ncbi:MAG: methionine biosynthesis protein MetW [bacterium]
MRTPDRPDHEIIYRIIEPGSKVLDLGCGSGDLLYRLARDKGARVQGIERDQMAIHECVKKGLSVFHGNIESGLSEYPDRSFDYVILNQSMQEVKAVDGVIEEALRIGAKAVVGFPNFAHAGSRCMLFFRGMAPVTDSLPYSWYQTPNVRFLSVTDFRDFCREKRIRVLAAHFLGRGREVRFWPNLLARCAIFLLSRAR